MAPHITFWIVARGINIGLHTRMYFADEAEANAEDPLLAPHRTPPSRRDAGRAARGRYLSHSTFICRARRKRSFSISRAFPGKCEMVFRPEHDV